jgi:hypothetical protein
VDPVIASARASIKRATEVSGGTEEKWHTWKKAKWGTEAVHSFVSARDALAVPKAQARVSVLSQACFFDGLATTKLKVWEPRRHEALILPGNRPGSIPPAEGVQRELGPPGCRLDAAKGGPARAARCKRPPGSQFGRKHQGGALGGRGYLEGKKKPSKFATDPLRSRCTPKGIPEGAGEVLRAPPLLICQFRWSMDLGALTAWCLSGVSRIWICRGPLASSYVFTRPGGVHRLIGPGVLSVGVVRERPRVVDLFHGGSSGPVIQCVRANLS